MGKYRERHNEKARAGFMKKKLELRSKRAGVPLNAQTELISEAGAGTKSTAPLTSSEKRKQKLREFLLPGVSNSAKRKRLEKYIDRQVRKEEKDELFKKLSESRIDLAPFQSMKHVSSTPQRVMEISDPEGSGSEDDRSDDDLSQSSPLASVEKANSTAPSVSSALSTAVAPANASNFSSFGFQNLTNAGLARKRGKKLSWREMLQVEKDDSDKTSESMFTSESDMTSSESSSEDDNGGKKGAQAEKIDKDLAAEQKSDSDVEVAKSSDAETEVSDSEESEETGHDEQSKSSTYGKNFAKWAKSNQPEFVHIPVIAPENYKHVARVEEAEPLPANMFQQTVERDFFKYVNVDRDEAISESRMRLPALASEQQIMEAIHHNDCVILTGETGSGKTTQVPQFLYEAGYGSSNNGMIGVTQPRRVAAISMADRVGKELGDHGKYVNYQIRFDSRVTAHTRIKFMTDGVLLRELTTDMELSKYSVIVIDEAHERSINTDILVGLLSRVVRYRREQNRPLKLVVMSATLRVTDFTENTSLFPVPPPLISVEARQHPVSIHFSRRTKPDYVAEAVSKACKIHHNLPKGGILIFLTGQEEIHRAIRMLKSKVEDSETSEAQNVKVLETAKDVVQEDETLDLDFDRDDFSDHKSDSDESDVEGNEGEEYDGVETKLKILPLYTLMPTSEQLKVFEPIPGNTRLCVIATNVAETSLTIPGIKYVIDCGRAKQKEYDQETGVQKLRVSWVSKASANQRAGRAGRSGPGHCYRLYSSALFEQDFSPHSNPEIMKVPIEGLVLQLKSMGIHKIINFPFPTPPPRESLKQGLRLLVHLGALQGEEHNLTDLGLRMSLFPLSPRHAKMLLIGNQFGCLPYVIAIVAALTVGDPFIPSWEIVAKSKSIEAKAENPRKRESRDADSDDDDDGKEDEAEDQLTREQRQVLHQMTASRGRFAALDTKSDILRVLSAVAGFDYATDAKQFCNDNFLRLKTLQEIKRLRGQLSRILAQVVRPDAIESVFSELTTKLAIPTKQQVAALKQIIATSYLDQIAAKASLTENIKLPKHGSASRTPYRPVFPTPDRSYVYIHPDSVLAKKGGTLPDFIVYNSLTTGIDENSKIRMRSLVDIDGHALSRLAFGTPLITYSKPLSGAYAPRVISAVEREAWVVPRFGAALGTGGSGWDLPARKVRQKRVQGVWEVVA